MFEPILTWPNFTLGKFSVVRKPIVNGGAIRPGGLLFRIWKERKPYQFPDWMKNSPYYCPGRGTNPRLPAHPDFLASKESHTLLVRPFTHELAYIMTAYDFLSAKQVILNNVWTDSNLTQFLFWSTFDRIVIYNDHITMTSYRLNKRFWEMFEPTSTWPNLYFL